MICFNIPPYVEGEEKYVIKAINNRKICGDGYFTLKCEELLEKKLGSKKIFLTTSGTSALEMACILANLKNGDEVILPSYTFSSTANSIVMTGATPVFVDIRKDTQNIDETKIEKAITNKTKAIMVVHYAGIGCEMNKIMNIAHKHNLLVIEDAAQAVNSKYKNKYLGTLGDFGCFSFHESKNYSMGEGGAISINNEKYIDRALIIREKGTNRTKFINGQTDKYTWIDKGSSYLPSDILAAYLYPQLLVADEIKKDRLDSFNTYQNLLKDVDIDLPNVPTDCLDHNGHMFYIKVKDLSEREKLRLFLREKEIESVFHYVPLHSSPKGQKIGRFVGEDNNTTSTYERLLRLPMYYHLTKEEIIYICNKIKQFYD